MAEMFIFFVVMTAFLLTRILEIKKVEKFLFILLIEHFQFHSTL